jgi:hypothetical protein
MRVICVGGPSQYDGSVWSDPYLKDGFLYFEGSSMSPGSIYRITEEERETPGGPASVAQHVGESVPRSQ